MFESLDYLAPTKTLDCSLGFRTPPETEPVTLELVYAGSGTTFFSEFSKLKSPARDAPQDERCAYRERVARLFATHAVKGWKHVSDASKEVPFTIDNCVALFRKLIRLPDASGAPVGRWDLIDGAIATAMSPDNFSDPIVSGADLGKG